MCVIYNMLYVMEQLGEKLCLENSLGMGECPPDTGLQFKAWWSEVENATSRSP